MPPEPQHGSKTLARLIQKHPGKPLISGYFRGARCFMELLLNNDSGTAAQVVALQTLLLVSFENGRTFGSAIVKTFRFKIIDKLLHFIYGTPDIDA